MGKLSNWEYANFDLSGYLRNCCGLLTRQSFDKVSSLKSNFGWFCDPIQPFVDFLGVDTPEGQ